MSQLFPFKSLSSTLFPYTQPTPVSGLENSTHTAPSTIKHTRQALEERINNSVAFPTFVTATLGRSSTLHSSLNSSFTPLPHVSPPLSLSSTSHLLISVLANTATLSDSLAASFTRQISTFSPFTHSYDTQQHSVPPLLKPC
ncbi:hypothetical protein QOT17_015328 [Balamuthia mandrillaris]